MSRYLDALCGRSRLQECAKSDPPGQLNFTDDQLAQADLDYLANREQRERERISETARMEQAVMTRAGWLL